ncbi:UNVERIFIED_ORG: hypothetical protein QE446_003771 [Rhizobium sp. SORGH_AS260]|uniref:hypothetical protein n=1 Tax=Agrobacterium sp. SORGH_AS_0440 TaxID=3041757 RepID=UPI00277D789C|nr:hypothetical protein [Agrobacterium sp. SORGH_AS_0440]MDP9732273.1 hypothetical protein [Rhizobium sp. SORGH_AS_0285]MDP9755895.1 hypothetical protein [Rhizobium sp. SORGH_AS_0260]MDR6081445.1 hypothetical protein [Agrobacterium sp. SORGH_AS_0440]
MTYPRIKTLTIDSHDEEPPLKWRMIDLGGRAYYLALDICPLYGLDADSGGDFRTALIAEGIDFIESRVDNLGEIIGPVSLITQGDHERLAASAVKRLAA